MRTMRSSHGSASGGVMLLVVESRSIVVLGKPRAGGTPGFEEELQGLARGTVASGLTPS